MSRWPCQVVFDVEHQDTTHVDVDSAKTNDEVTLVTITNEQSQDGEDPPQLGVLVSDCKVKNNAVTTSVDTKILTETLHTD